MDAENYRAVDVHAHVLFGVDDGARDIREALALLKLDYEQGVRAVFATPHFGIENGYAPPAEKIRHAFDELRRLAALEIPDLALYLGTEWYCAEDAADRMTQGQAYSMNGTDCVLVEFMEYGGMSESPECMQRRLFQLQQAGYRPILAHAERYRGLQKEWQWLKRFFEQGVLLQVNAYDIVQNPKEEIRALSQWLAQERMIAFIGSDMHGLPPRRSPQLRTGIEWLYAHTDREYADDVVYRNAQKILMI